MESLRPSYAIGLVAVLSAAAFAPALRAPFLGEAFELIADNPLVHGFGHSLEWFSTGAGVTSSDPAFIPSGLHAFRPVVMMSHAFDWAMGQGSPLAFHVTNLFFHAVAAVLAYLTLHRWTGEGSAALVGGLLFALHPSKANAVAGLGAREQILCAVGIMMALRGLGTRLRGQSAGLLTEGIGLALAFGSSEQALALPALALVEAWVASGRSALARVPRALLLSSVVPYAVLACAYAVGRALLLGPLPAGPSVATHAGLVLESAGRLAELAVWPADLTDGRAIKEVLARGGPPLIYAVLGALVLLSLTAATTLLMKRRPPVAVAVLSLLALLLGSSNLIYTAPDALVSPADLYLPALGLGWLTAELLRPALRTPALGLAIALVVAAVCGARATLRARDYASFSRYWALEVVHPGALPRAYADAARAELDARRPAAALALASKAPAKMEYTGAPRQLTRLVHVAFAAAMRVVPDRPSEPLVALETAARSLRELQPALLPQLDPSSPLSRVLARQPAFGNQIYVERRAANTSASALLKRGQAAAPLGKLGLDPDPLAPLPGEPPVYGGGLPGPGVAELSPLGRALASDPGELERIELELASRMGDDKVAVEGIERLVQRCPRCWHYRASAVTIAARAGMLDKAAEHFERLRTGAPSEEVLELRGRLLEAKRAQKAAQQAPEKERVRYEMRYQSALGGWGRAYTVARPLLERVPTDRDLAELLVEVAFRAGERAKADALMKRHLRDEDPNAWFERWSLAMQWTDAPRLPDDHPLEL